MTTSEPTIVVDRVRKRFRLYHRRETTLKAALLRRNRAQFEEFWAVDDVSFAVQSGETLGIFGRNGSGKSTMLKMLARILRPDAGHIAVNGRVSALLEVGAGFHPEYTAVENIFLSGAIYGLSKEELRPRVDEIIAFAQLERFADNPVKTDSSGQAPKTRSYETKNVKRKRFGEDGLSGGESHRHRHQHSAEILQASREGGNLWNASRCAAQSKGMCSRFYLEQSGA